MLSFLVVGILSIGGGLFSLVKPQKVFYFTQSWKHNNSIEPSKWYIFSTRFGGFIGLVFGIACIVFFTFWL